MVGAPEPNKYRPLLHVSQDRILAFRLRGRIGKGHEIALQLVSGADFRRVLHRFSARLEGSWGHAWPEGE